MSNLSGTSGLNRVVWMDCSKAAPCHDIKFENFDVTAGTDDDSEINFVCNNVALGGGDGLNQCHPSNSKHEAWDDGADA